MQRMPGRGGATKRCRTVIRLTGSDRLLATFRGRRVPARLLYECHGSRTTRPGFRRQDDRHQAMIKGWIYPGGGWPSSVAHAGRNLSGLLAVLPTRMVRGDSTKPSYDLMSIVNSFSFVDSAIVSGGPLAAEGRFLQAAGTCGRGATDCGYWRAKAARASLARSTKDSPLTSMRIRLMVPPTKAQGRSPG